MLAEYLFVYGTLKQSASQSRYHYLEGLTEFFAYATASGHLYLVEDKELPFIYPAFIYDEESTTQVRGELYVITDKEALFQILDEYEGCSDSDPPPHQYLRKQVTVKANVAFEYQAWTYIYNWPVDHFTEIKSGNFL